MQFSDFHRLLIAFVLAAARIGGALAICPATSSSMITGVARNAATLSFAALLVPCVQRWMPPYGGPEPLRLISVPGLWSLNSVFHERTEDLIPARGPMILCLHPDDAAARGIATGDDIEAFNDLARVRFTAFVTDLTAKGAAAAPGVYAHSLTKSGLGVNALQHARLTDLAEATTMNDNTVEVRKYGG